MRDQFNQLLSVLALDYRRAKLSWLLAGINIALVLLVVAGISLSAVRLLRNLADDQGLVRVQFAGATAREELRKIGEDTLTSARSLAARPTLRRMVTEETPNAVELFLRRACQTASADICAVTQGSQVIAQSGLAVSWKEVFAASSEQGERFMAAPPAPAPALLGAVARVESATAGEPDLRVYVLRAFEVPLAAKLTERAGLNVRLVSYRAFANLNTDAFTPLHSNALSDGRSSASRINSLDLFASSFPVFASTGEAIALIETRLPAAELDASVKALVRRLLITALVLGALAVAAAVWLGQQVAEPVRALTDAATRLGHGDFSTSIPADGAAEVGVLSRTMEDMRRNLVELTGTLRRREAEAQAVLNGVVEGVYAVDKERNFTYLNPQAAKLLNVDAEQIKGKFCGDVLKPKPDKNGERPCDRRCPILQARQDGSSRAIEYLCCTEGEPRTTIITSAAPVDGLQVQVMRDETDLEAVRRARDSVLANISHEFRTPLAAQLASIELLSEGLESMAAKDRRELVLSLERGTHRLTRLIDNLLESVRIESGQLNIRRQSLTLAELIEDAQALLGSLFELREQKLVVDLPHDLPWINGDGPRLTQVFVNLLANANKFAPQRSTVHVGASADTNAKLLTAWVEDEGPGVPASAQATIFDRFSRGPEEEPEPGGLGLGLWIVKSIVERHGGTVSANRTAQGRTRFSVVLPLEADALETGT